MNAIENMKPIAVLTALPLAPLVALHAKQSTPARNNGHFSAQGEAGHTQLYGRRGKRRVGRPRRILSG